MVCNRCKMVMEQELSKLGLHPTKIELGEITIDETLNANQLEGLNKVISKVGFTLIDDKKGKIIELIKKNILQIIYDDNEKLKINFSAYISQKLQLDYLYLSRLFSEVEGVTIEQYFINQKIERVKELLVYNEHSLSQIAFDMNYSSVSHLSKQFKKITGFTPGYFKKLKEQKRKTIESI